jgi:hypothetical protein
MGEVISGSYPAPGTIAPAVEVEEIVEDEVVVEDE